MKKVKLKESDIENLVKKIIKEDLQSFERMTISDMQYIDELYEEGMDDADDIALEMNHKDYITSEMVQHYLNSKYGINENTYDFDWSEQLGGRGENKWHDLELDLSTCIEPLLEKYKNDFGVDSYGVIDAIYQVLEGMFQKK
jgi:hypothetical protein